MILIWTGLSMGAPAAVVGTDFDKMVSATGATTRPDSRVTGQVPAGWRDNSEWAKVTVGYQRLTEEGRPFLRMSVSRIENGWGQLCHPMPRITEDTLFQLTLTARASPAADFECGIRQSGQPYKFLWSVRPSLTADWKTFTYSFRAKAEATDVGFFVLQQAEGKVDIAELRLLKRTREEIIEEFKAKYPDGGPKNLLRVSRFPLGLQSGWSVFGMSTNEEEVSLGENVTVAPDPNVIGPSGSPALRIWAQKPVKVWAAPFAVLLPFEKHVASLYARGKGPGRLAVRVGGGDAGSARFAVEPGDGWKRLEAAFMPDIMANLYGLRIECQGEIWIDAMQVNRGAKAEPYASQMPVEVALACPNGDASVGRAQFTDEPAVVRYCVTGKAPGATLKSKVVTVYGQKPLPDVKLGGEFLSYGELKFGVFEDKPYGPYRIEAWVEDGGKRISTYNEIVLYRLRRPRYWGKDAPDSPFGIHMGSMSHRHVMAKAVGVNWTRLHDAGMRYIGWYWLEREKGKWEFRDKDLQRYRDNHIKILGELGTAPEWASYFPGKKHDGYFDRYYQPKRMEDYAEYVRTVASRYKGMIDAWDVWNEPWIYAWWGIGYEESKTGRSGYVTSKTPQADFVRLTRTAYETVKSVDANMVVLGMNSTTGGGEGAGETSIGGAAWTRGIVEANGLDWCDVVCYHNYTNERQGFPEDSVTKGFRTATGAVAERYGRVARPVWMSEGSGAMGYGFGFYNHTLPHENGEPAVEVSDRLCRYMVSLLGNGVSRIFLYALYGEYFTGETGKGWSVLTTQDGYLHPMAAAHAALAWRLEDTKFVKMVTWDRGTYVYLFEAKDGGHCVAVFARKSDGTPKVLPRGEGVEVEDLFGNPVAKDQPLGDSLIYMTVKGSPQDVEKLLK